MSAKKKSTHKCKTWGIPQQARKVSLPNEALGKANITRALANRSISHHSVTRRWKKKKRKWKEKKKENSSTNMIGTHEKCLVAICLREKEAFFFSSYILLLECFPPRILLSTFHQQRIRQRAE